MATDETNIPSRDNFAKFITRLVIFQIPLVAVCAAIIGAIGYLFFLYFRACARTIQELATNGAGSYSPTWGYMGWNPHILTLFPLGIVVIIGLIVGLVFLAHWAFDR